MQNPSTKCPPFSYNNGFFLKIIHVMDLLIKNVKQTHFLNGFSTRNSKILNGLDVYQCYSPQKKKSTKNSTHNLNFEIYM